MTEHDVVAEPQGARPEGHVPAGEYSSWLHATRAALKNKGEAEVACGECVGCCSSSYFVHLGPGDHAARARIPQRLLFRAPGLPKGHQLMGYDEHGRCPMLRDNRCQIYAARPHTCRSYDCRVFTAAGLTAGGAEAAQINARVSAWRFSYRDQQAQREHAATLAAARFLLQQRDQLPADFVPRNPAQVAVLALKVYAVFLPSAKTATPGPAELQRAVVTELQHFERSAAG